MSRFDAPTKPTSTTSNSEVTAAQPVDSSATSVSRSASKLDFVQRADEMRSKMEASIFSM